MKKLNLPHDLKPADRMCFENCLYRILDAAIDADYAILGNIQLFDANHQALQIIAQRGFDLNFLNHFAFARSDDGSVCGRAFSEQRRVTISDVAVDPLFAAHWQVARSSGFRAVQSTPVVTRGAVRGVLSTHFSTIHSLSENATVALDSCAREIGKLLEQFEV